MLPPPLTENPLSLKHHLVGIQDDALILSVPYIVQSLVEVFSAALNRSRVLLITRQVRVNELNQTINVFGGHLQHVSHKSFQIFSLSPTPTYRFVLLVKVVHVAIQDLNKQLDRRRRLHARVSHAKSSL